MEKAKLNTTTDAKEIEMITDFNLENVDNPVIYTLEEDSKEVYSNEEDMADIVSTE